MSGRGGRARLPRMPGQGTRPKASLVAAAQAQASSSNDAAANGSAGSSTTHENVPTAAASEPEPIPERPLELTTEPVLDPITEPIPEAMDVDPPVEVAPLAPEPQAPPPKETPALAPEEVDVKPVLRKAPRVPPPAPASVAISRTTSAGSTPAPSDAPSTGVTKMKFKPKMPIRRNTQPAAEAVAATPEPETSSSRPARGGAARGRGRGGARGGRGGAVATNTIAAGPFGGARAGSSRRVIPAAPSRSFMSEMQTAEVYSDNEDGTRTGVIDIEAVSALGESAPTSLWRDRDLGGGKAKAKAAEKAKLKDLKRRKKESTARSAVLAAGQPGVTIKDEPVSPTYGDVQLPRLPRSRIADSMIDADETQDRDEVGRRIRATTSGTTGTTESDEINAAQAVDLSESESEEEEEDMEGDFVYVPGLDNPEDKLFTFQFPPGFPKFVSKTPAVVDATGDLPEPDVKPTSAALKKKKAAVPPPAGRIGTLCVMKSGKVKLVLGEGDAGIVMNVTPGVNASFVQQLVHVDQKAKATTVLGEVHKGYVVTPDLDRLLEELFINGGETPGDRERAQAAAEMRVKVERGLVKMEQGSP